MTIKVATPRRQQYRGKEKHMAVEVLSRQPCPECEDGVIPLSSTEWRNFHGAFERWQAQGSQGQKPVAPTTPEEIPCNWCKGTAMKEEWLNLKTLKAMLNQ